MPARPLAVNARRLGAREAVVSTSNDTVSRDSLGPLGVANRGTQGRPVSGTLMENYDHRRCSISVGTEGGVGRTCPRS